MAKLLILFAHPALEKSRVHQRMIRHVQHLEQVYFHDLYETYPDLDIDVSREKQLLLDHDLVIWQHPFYWYSSPAIIKQWLDLVLEHNWAYGSQGKMLAGKRIFNAISCGGTKEAYTATGRNRFTIPQLLAPFEQTAVLCQMKYLPPFVVHGTHRLREADIELYAIQYEQLLVSLAHDRISEEEYQAVTYLNELCPIPEQVQS
ncbi:MAG TPA: NAD(P)H-dependent oxidoreductase [Chitinophagaceae bacterium]|nr:NAD(P)H-dependent oxidoreductase [Chitinophagaceae bacterium]